MNLADNSLSYNKTRGTRPGFVFFVTILAAIAVVACKEVSFRDPQPKGFRSLQQVPAKMQGNYLFKDKDGQVDTIVITANSFYAKSEPNKDRYILSDTLIMKTYKGYYFFSKRSGTVWYLRVVKQQKNGDLAYLAMNDEHFNDFLVRLSREIKIDSADFGDGMVYQIDPTPKQLIDLIEKGYFVEQAKWFKLK
jgi:hypothetical protein